VQEAAQRKVAGEEAVSAAPTEPSRGKVIDLMSALKASLEKRGAAEKAEKAEKGDEAEAAQEEEPKQAASASSRSGGRSTGASHAHASTKSRKRK